MLKVTTLMCMNRYPKHLAKCYTDGLATEDTKSFCTIRWGDEDIAKDCFDPVGKFTCSFKSKLAVFYECIMTLRERHRGEKQFCGAVIFFYCQVLLQTPNIQISPKVSDSDLEVDKLRNKGVKLPSQWIPSYVGTRGNEKADRCQAVPQPDKLITFVHSKMDIRHGMAELWTEAPPRRGDISLTEFRSKAAAVEIHKAQDSLYHGNAVQVFRMRVGCTLLRKSMKRKKNGPSRLNITCMNIIRNQPATFCSDTRN